MVATLPTQQSAPTSAEKLLTAEEYWALPDCADTELINGKVTPVSPTGFEHGQVAVIIASHLYNFVRQHKLGYTVTETGFRLTADPDTVRAPDISYIEASRLPAGQRVTGFIDGAPTLAVEVVSPNDNWRDVEEKVRLYLETGTLTVWIVEPFSQTVTIRTAGSSRTLQRADTLTGGDTLPGFELPLAELFSS